MMERVHEPPEGEAFNRWVALEDAADLLRADLDQDDIILYCSFSGTFIHGILVPSDVVTSLDTVDLMQWNGNPYGSWGVLCSFDPLSARIESPLSTSPSKTIATGEQLVFARKFEGVSDRPSIELLQKLIHVFGLHYQEERSGYCRLDGRGDLEDVVSITRIDHEKGRRAGGIIVTIGRAVIDEYMALTGTTMVRMFDLTRVNINSFGGWERGHDARLKTIGDLMYRGHVEPGNAGYMRGVQIFPSRMSNASAAKRHCLGDPQDREYASFVAVDFKTGKTLEISTEPGQTANYFTHSDLPFEMSPAFFRADVLLRYKNDSDKYTLRHRSISCRGAWDLKTYDINDAGQVHTYIVYLRDLPYEEQLIWKAHNEPPTAPISKRAVRTDFEGSWDNEYDGLESLQQAVRRLNEIAPSWWNRRSDRVVEGVHYPVTTSPDEWAEEILRLDQCVIEGLSRSRLRTLATSLGRMPDAKLGSLKLVEECLMGLGWEEERAREVTAPMHGLHYYRSEVKAHSGGQGLQQLKKEVLREHGSYGKHYRALCAECDTALRTIYEALEQDAV